MPAGLPLASRRIGRRHPGASGPVRRPRTSTTPAESPSSATLPGAPATTSSPRRSPRCATSSTAAPPAPSPTPGTAPASCPGTRRLPARGGRLRPARGRRVRRRHRVPARRRRGTRQGRGRGRADRRRGGADGSLGWRDVPVTAATARGHGPRASCRLPRSCSSPRPRTGCVGIALDRLAFCLRKRAEHETSRSTSRRLSRGPSSTRACSPPTSSSRSTPTCPTSAASALALVHSRFSTNTFPSWPLAHPFRFIAHNGEINTVMGNRNWMRAREALLAATSSPATWSGCTRSARPGASDSASFDEVLELLHLGGRTLPHAVLMMIPEAWENHAEMDPDRRAFYRFHATLMEPWDGPACVAFTDGTHVGAVLDRNGLRPVPLLGDRRRARRAGQRGRRARHRPGDRRAQGPAAAGPDVPGRHRRAPDRRGRGDQGRLAAEHPYDEWLHAGLIHLDDLPEREHVCTPTPR